MRSAEPLATAGIILIFVFLALLDIGDLRDRFLRLLGGNFHRSTDAIQEAGARISRYLLMQLLVNVSYGVPLAAGLWIIGVPGALLWGAVGAVMRFVPYVGPLIAAIFPIALAFAVDSGWSMLLWTVALIVVLELTSNNIVEPLLYGSSTGLSAISLIAAAILWTALWGPVGLILSTPLTVCLLVLGRNLPQLRFLDTMLGSTPALDVPARIYQRLIANDADEAVEIASTEIEKSSVVSFYDAIGIEVLRLASEEYLQNASAEHRLRLASGMDTLLDDLERSIPLLPESGGKANGPVHRRKMGDRCPRRRDAGPCARFRRDRRSFPTRCKRQCRLSGQARPEGRGHCLPQLLYAESSHPRSPRLPASAKTMAECAHRSGAMERAAGTVD